MTDDLAIINACSRIFRTSEVKACFFHLSQSIYRKVQAEGLQIQYADAENEDVRTAARMMAAVAFFPLEDVIQVFDEYMDEITSEFVPIAEYFEVFTFYIFTFIFTFLHITGYNIHF